MIRRVFLSRFPALAMVRASYGAEQTRTGTASWAPARHAPDDWLDANTAQHRVVVDTFTADRFPDGLQFSGNLFETNLAAYDIAVKDMAVLLVVRHSTTPFGYNDAMW